MGDAIIESGEDSGVHRDGERSAVLYFNSLFFEIGGMVCDCTDDLE